MTWSSDLAMLDRRARRSDESAWSTVSPDGGIATAHWLASRAGGRVLSSGGNAIDAAVAASLALAVCESAGSGIGGMALMTVHLAEEARTFTVEGPCRAPLSATPELVLESHRYRGYRAVAVPTYVGVLDHVLRQYGTWSAERVLAPAIDLAERGVPVTVQQHALAHDSLTALSEHSAGRLFLDAGGRPWPVGHRFRQPALAKTLRRLAEAGFRDFYSGDIADRIDRDMRAHGGFVRAADLEEAAMPTEGQTVTAPCNGGVAHTLGPPGGGLALAQLLNMLDSLNEACEPETPRGILVLAALIRRARQDRRALSRTITAQGIHGAAELLDPGLAGQAAREVLSELGGPGETSHLSVADRWGNVVALTQSVERSFGSAEVQGELGFLYNGYLRGFKVRNEQHPHFLRPGAVARSNAAPTIVLRSGEPWAALGSTGSERMVSGIFLTLVHLRTRTPFESVHAPRLHCTPEGDVLWEASRFPRGSRELLESHGFTTSDFEDYSFRTGGLQLVARQGSSWVAIADPRRDGAAAAPKNERDARGAP